ncbi:3-hydroxybutyrate dehydrogenase [Staphylospora marina]|uniref:3-hydroxybutyrate dehydrogenase n=1 Tax=Staphylospora marina TaxID=2490858 RepID=UPI001F15641B|nr:3-hydroxybutyrate dehydrogenase [Staphylospora marina]
MKRKPRTVIVTGAAGTIGSAISRAFAENGDFVAVVDLDGERATRTAGNISGETGGEAAGFGMDVTDEHEIRRLVQHLTSERGGVDVVVNNAGLQHIAPVEDFPTDRWNHLLNVMLTAPFLLIKHAVPVMKRQGFGRIINIASVHGRTASPYKAAYISAKHGLVGLTRTVALETAEHGITCNAVMPGVVDTPLVRNQLRKLSEADGISEEEALHKHLLHKQALKRFIKPEEIAGCCLWLASETAASVTGEAIGVSGGW